MGVGVNNSYFRQSLWRWFCRNDEKTNSFTFTGKLIFSQIVTNIFTFTGELRVSQICSPVKENKEEKGQEKDEEGNPSEIGLGGIIIEK